MIIKTLTLENFKNQQKLSIAFGKGVTNIFGANGAGKTTVLDALSFLLWGKAHDGKSDTNMRPYGADGEAIHDINTVVRGEFLDEASNYAFILEVNYQEKWSKISGTDERKLMGNTTEYAVDGVPKKQKEYAAFVAEWFVEPWFSLTTNPAAFPSLSWQEQRKVLLDLLGDVTPEEIIKQNPELQDIGPDIIKFGVDDLKAKLTKELKAYKKQAVELPARIDERRKSLSSSLEDAEALDKKAKLTLLKYQEPLDKLLAERAAIVNGSRRSEIEAKILEIKAKMDVIRASYREAIANIKRPFEDKLKEVDNEVKSNSDLLRQLRPQLLVLDKSITSKETKLEQLTEEWRTVDNSVFEDTECPCCHRPYTEEMLEPMLAQFNTDKAAHLQRLDMEGMAISQKLDELRTAKKELAIKVNELSTYEVEKAPQSRQDIMEAMRKTIELAPPLEEFVHPETHEKFWELAESLKLREKELEECRLDINIQLQKKDAEIAKARIPVQQANEALTRLKLDAETREAIAQLEAEKRNALLKQGDAEYKFSLVDKYTRIKMASISQKVNDAMNDVEVKLFENNISNNGVRETCELMLHGVPYRQLSNAEKCRAGMEVIRAISSRLDLHNPVFVDNRESVTDIGDWNGQLVNLYVSPEDKVLRVEAQQ